MYYYFSAEFNAVIKINGVILGRLFDDIKGCDILSNNTFVEICPLDTKENYISFYIDNFEEPTLTNLPNSIMVTNLKGGYLFNAKSTLINTTFKVIGGLKENNFSCSIFFDKGLNISIDSGKDFFVEALSIDAISADIHYININGYDLCSITLETKKGKFLVIYNLNDKICRVFLENIISVEYTNGIYITCKIVDIAKHTIKFNITINDNKLSKTNVLIETSDTFDIEKISEKILPFAFFEEFIIGGNVTNFLDENMKENINSLPNYLGDFIGIMPPPFFRDIDEVGLIYKEQENLYYVKYIKVQIVKRKITNIQFSE